MTRDEVSSPEQLRDKLSVDLGREVSMHEANSIWQLHRFETFKSDSMIITCAEYRKILRALGAGRPM